MDIVKLLKNVHNLTEYISTTQDASEKCKTSKIQLNMSSVLALKKIRSLEIEYFNKCEDNGIACIIFERMLSLPRSKTWGVLSKELVNLLQYWLDAVRKHLVRHNSQWWTFLKLLLKFVKEIHQKDVSLPNILVEDTAECLLDLATNSRPDPTQRYEILHCFNMYCSESSREIRFALRNRLGQYFKKLATYMANCGHLPTQYSIMETLLRWLLPRQDRDLRVTSAAKWFPTPLYEDSDVNIFLERPWINFFQDARDFLNAHNQRHDVITSVVCRKLTVGEVVIISGTDRQESWLDINLSTRCVSVLLDPRALETFGSKNHKSFETLYITHDNTETVKLYKESEQLILSIRTTTPPRIVPSDVDLGRDVSCDVTAVISTRSDVTRLDHALNNIFDEKYQVLLDLSKELELSPIQRTQNSSQNNGTEDARFSHPVEVKRRKHSGYIVHSRQATSCMSPSTASTSSLAQLHEKLAALPRYRFDKEPVSVCALPELSIVTEVSEADDRQSLNTTQLVKNKPYGVCYRNLNKYDNRKSQSEPETSTKVRKSRGLSPIVNESTTSCLLVATIGSADDSVINDTLERITKSKDYSGDNIVDLLVQEALQAKYESGDKSDSGINTGEKKAYLTENSETIENTPNADEIKVSKVQKKSKVVSSTSDESNTDAINDTPCFVNIRKKKDIVKEPQRPCFDEHVVEQFFSQHFTENKAGEVVISPTLAKKINETSSETSDDFGDNFNLITEEDINCDFNEIDVLECLNSMVDKVCDEFDKCTTYLNNENEIDKADESEPENISLLDIINTVKDIETKDKENTRPETKKMKLKYKISKKTKTRTMKGKKDKLKLEPPFKMSTIIEDSRIEEAAEETSKHIPLEPEVIIITAQEQKKKVQEEFNEKLQVACNKKIQKKHNENVPKNSDKDLQTECNVNLRAESKEDLQEQREQVKTPVLRRKRKLYSPKDGNAAEVSVTNIEEDNVASETEIKKTPKSTATCYKEIEKERQKRIRKPRTRKNNREPPSPRTKKINDMFDKLKESSNGEKVLLADKAAEIYNFTSDSDDDFKEKGIKISKRNSTTTVHSVESNVSKHGRALKRINYTDNVSSDEINKPKRKITRRPRTKKKIQIERVDLVDERMRKAEDRHNTSITVENPKKIQEETVLEFVPKVAPEMEIIEDKTNDRTNSELRKKSKKVKNEIPEPKRSKRVLNKPVDKIDTNAEDDRTQSPLPGLLVEPVNANIDDVNDISSTMVDKFKKFYQEGPDKYINESNTTHNLLSDVERVNFSQPDVEITEELKHIEDEVQENYTEPKEKVTKNTKVIREKAKNTKKVKNTNVKKQNNDNNNVVCVRDSSIVKSVQSIATDGITGHGESDEAPPSPKLINETFEPRNLEVEYLDDSTKDYFNKLTKVMNVSDRDSSGSNRNELLYKKDKSETVAKSVSPVVSVCRMSIEDFRKWSKRNSETDESVSSKSEDDQNSQGTATKNRYNPKHSNNESPKKLSRLRKETEIIIDNSRSKDDTDTEINEFKIFKSRIANKSPILTRAKSKITKPLRKISKNISPIKMFEDMNSVDDTNSEKSISDDEEPSVGIMRTLLAKKANEKLRRNTPQRNVLRKNVKSIDSASSKMSTSTKKDAKVLKRISEDDRSFKREKIEVNNNVTVPSASSRTVSSVDDWFKRIELDSSNETKHILQNVMEKLDTTLTEIHRNTSKHFVHLFVETQKHLSDLEEERRGLYKKTAADMFRDIVKIVDEKFADLDKRSQELNNSFMKQMQERASELMREDCKKKRLLVQLLKEDVQAVLDHVEKQGTM